MMLILRGDIADDQMAAAVGDYQGAFSEHGEVEVNEWGKRKLAFPMNHATEGFYVVMNINSDKKTLAETESRMKLDDRVLRYMVVRQEATVPAATAS
jgi:small subunit ribosomal protein S6